MTAESRITNLERRIEELKKKQQQSSLNTAETTHEIEETEQPQPKIHLTKSQKYWLAASIVLTVTPLLNLFATSTGHSWSNAYEIYIATYKAIFHLPVDWLFGWIGLKIPSWAKDTALLSVCGVYSLNQMVLQDMGKSYWNSIELETENRGQENSEQGPLGPIALAFCRAVFMFYAILILTTGVVLFALMYKKMQKKGEAKAWQSTVSLGYAFYSLLVLVVVVEILNMVLLKIGL